eukprot:194418-Chlamydomonas_euryale.AAC.2
MATEQFEPAAKDGCAGCTYKGLCGFVCVQVFGCAAFCDRATPRDVRVPIRDISCETEGTEKGELGGLKGRREQGEGVAASSTPAVASALRLGRQRTSPTGPANPAAARPSMVSQLDRRRR